MSNTGENLSLNKGKDDGAHQPINRPLNQLPTTSGVTTSPFNPYAGPKQYSNPVNLS